LSGGLDSSLVTALAVAESRRPVKTFAIGFAESTYDERAAAADVAARLGTEHHEVVLTPSGARDLLPDVARIFDEPFADATALPAVLLARLARGQVTVALSGDGGDELFCGYPTQTAHGAADLYARVPAALHRAVAAAAERLPTSHRYLSFDFALRRFLREVRRPALERHLRWMGSFAPETLGSLLVPQVQREVLDPEPYREAYEAAPPPCGTRRPAGARDPPPQARVRCPDRRLAAGRAARHADRHARARPSPPAGHLRRASGVRDAGPAPARHGQPSQGALDA